MVDKPARIQVDNISLNFGEVQALLDVSFDIKQDELLAIIGPNGSGKTSLLNCISGYYRPQKGDIRLDGQSVLGLPVYERTKLGFGRTFQNVELFLSLSVLETLLAARFKFMKRGALSNVIYFGPTRNEELEQRRIVEEIIDFLELERVRHSIVGSLPYGLRKRVSIGVGLAVEPQILFLDEPLAGMNLEEKEDLVRFILDIHEGARFGYESEFLNEGVKTIVIIEHDMGVVMDIAEKIVVIDFGHKIAEGLPEEISVSPGVIKAYLGETLTV